MTSISKWILAGCLLCVLQASAEIYKWRDDKGVMNYSDVPPPVSASGTQKIKAATVPHDIPMTHSDAFQREEMAAGNQKRATPAESAAGGGVSPEAEALKAMQERLKAQNCASARSNYRNYAVGGRVQTVNEGGQKEYMNDEQIKDGLARAQQEIDENCPSE